MLKSKHLLKTVIFPYLREHKYSSISKNSASIKRICVVGAGPAGFYAAQYLMKTLNDCHVDVIEKLPVPFGLVRFGVAPDHPEVKNVINTFSKTAENPRFRFLGNVSLGTDVSLQELRQSYHAVLLTYGADKDRVLNIPNESQSNVISARQFVAWYNGLPGAQDFKPDLSGRAVTIVGQGNVAVDVARILLSTLDELKKTDTTDFALEALSSSHINQVYLVGRRGPLQAAFTIKELREMLKLTGVETRWRKEDFEGVQEVVGKLERPRKRITELMLKSLTEQHQNSTQGKKQFLPVFWRAPKSVLQDNTMEFSLTTLENNSAIATNDTEKFPADLVLRSVGYKSTSVDGGICFNEESGQVANIQGRVLVQTNSKEIDKGLYVAGWLGTGPTGVILTTMNGAFGVAKTICDDILSGCLSINEEKSGLNISNLRTVTWEHWKRIDQIEQERGKVKGKPREKITDVEKMLKIAGL